MKNAVASGFFLILTACFCLFFPGTAKRLESAVITEIKPTHTAQKVKQISLKKVGQLSVEEEYKDFFLVKPTAFAAGPNGEFFIFDRALPTIFHLDRQLNLVQRIGRGGLGPGEIHPGDSNPDKLYVSADNRLIVCDCRNLKLIEFDFSGKMLRELPLAQKLKMRTFRPVMDKKGNFYTISIHGGGVDKWSADGKLLKTYLNESVYSEYLLYKPPTEMSFKGYHVELNQDKSASFNTSYDWFANNRLAILTATNATLYVFRDDQPVLEKRLWVEEELPIFRETIEQVKKMNEANAGRGISICHLMNEIIRDADDNQTFYISGAITKQGRSPFYRFDLEGRLLEVYHVNEPFNLKYKRNNRFYGYKKGVVSIFELGDAKGG